MSRAPYTPDPLCGLCGLPSPEGFQYSPLLFCSPCWKNHRQAAEWMLFWVNEPISGSGPRQWVTVSDNRRWFRVAMALARGTRMICALCCYPDRRVSPMRFMCSVAVCIDCQGHNPPALGYLLSWVIEKIPETIPGRLRHEFMDLMRRQGA